MGKALRIRSFDAKKKYGYGTDINQDFSNALPSIIIEEVASVLILRWIIVSLSLHMALQISQAKTAIRSMDTFVGGQCRIIDSFGIRLYLIENERSGENRHAIRNNILQKRSLEDNVA